MSFEPDDQESRDAIQNLLELILIELRAIRKLQEGVEDDTVWGE